MFINFIGTFNYKIIIIINNHCLVIKNAKNANICIAIMKSEIFRVFYSKFQLLKNDLKLY